MTSDKRQFDAEVALHFSVPRRLAFYDTDADGQLDLVLLDHDPDANADRRFTRGHDGRWSVEDDIATPFLDPTVLSDPKLRAQFAQLVAGLERG